MAWRVGKSLLKLRDQINRQHPGRKKHADGTIGDAAHASRKSDHNPWVKDGSTGIVTAMDITHDPRTGPDTWALAEFMRQQKDPRIKYLISNRRIFSSPAYTWRKYTGSNPHSGHVHISVHSAKAHYDNDKPWTLTKTPPGGGTDPEIDSPKKRPILKRGSTGEDVREVQTILQIKVDGQFGPITEAAVKGFQRESDIDLKVDGIVGPATWAELDKIQQRNDGESQDDQLGAD